jgi:hypothetical protein
MQLIGRRLARVSEPSRHALGVASVLGHEWDFGVLAQALELDEQALVDALEEPLRMRAVEEVAAAPGRFAFHHALVRDVLYGQLSPARRRLFHKRAGAALERLSAGRSERPLAELARHFAEAAPLGEWQRAIAYSEDAGHAARSAYAYERAAEHFAGAAQLLSASGQERSEHRVRVLLRLGEAQENAGDHAGARDTFGTARALALDLAKPELAARAALGFAGRRITSFGMPQAGAAAVLEEALAALPPGADALTARVLARLAHARYLAAPPAEVERLAGAALPRARASGDPMAIMDALEARLFATWTPGGAEERLAAATELIEVAEANGRLDRLAEGLNWRLITALELGDCARLAGDTERYATLARTLATPQLEAYRLCFRSLAALLQGRLDDAERDTVAAIMLAGDAGDVAQTTGLQLFTIRDAQDRLGELEPQLAEFVGRFPDIPGWELALAWARLRSGRSDEAGAVLESFYAGDFGRLPLDANWRPALMLAARIADALRHAPAGEAIIRLLRPFTGTHVVAGFAVWWGPVEHALGLAERAAGRDDDAGRWFAAAEAAARRLGAQPPHPPARP